MDAVWIVAAGTALWFVLFVVQLPIRHRLAADGHRVWLWTTLAGWVLGLIGLPLAWRARAAARRARTAAGPDPPDSVAGPSSRPGADPSSHQDTAGLDAPLAPADRPDDPP